EVACQTDRRGARGRSTASGVNGPLDACARRARPCVAPQEGLAPAVIACALHRLREIEDGRRIEATAVISRDRVEIGARNPVARTLFAVDGLLFEHQQADR